MKMTTQKGFTLPPGLSVEMVSISAEI